MKYNIIRAKYTGAGIVHKLNKLVGTYKSPDLDDLENQKYYNDTEINILVFDYTPVASGNILIKYPGKKWEKLRMNSKIVNNIKNIIDYKSPHLSVKSNWLSSIRRSNLNTIKIKDKK